MLIGVIIALLAGQILFLQRTLMKQLHEIEDICVKLIDRWNRSDEARDRRHEDMMKEINDNKQMIDVWVMTAPGKAE